MPSVVVLYCSTPRLFKTRIRPPFNVKVSVVGTNETTLVPAVNVEFTRFTVTTPAPALFTVASVKFVYVIGVAVAVLYVNVPVIVTLVRLVGALCVTALFTVMFDNALPVTVTPPEVMLLNFVPPDKTTPAFTTITIAVTKFVPSSLTGCVSIVGYSSCACIGRVL